MDLYAVAKANSKHKRLLELGHRVFSNESWEYISQSLGLSPREFQIVQQVFDGEKELAIARNLGISSHTVHTYFGRLYRKLGVSSRCELIVAVLAHFVTRGHLGKGESTDL